MDGMMEKGERRRLSCPNKLAETSRRAAAAALLGEVETAVFVAVDHCSSECVGRNSSRNRRSTPLA